MLDPVSSIAVAAAMLDFVQFGNTVIKAVYNTYKVLHGDKSDSLSPESALVDLADLTSKLKEVQDGTASNESEDEKALRGHAKACLAIAKELEKMLDKLKAKENLKGISRVGNVFTQQLRRLRKANEIERLQASLERIKSEIGVRLLSILRDNNSSMLTLLKGLSDMSSRYESQSAKRIDDARNELLTAVHQVSERLGEEPLDKIITKLQNLLVVQETATASYAVLDSLYFPQMKSRQADIALAHESTLGWVLDQEVTSFKTWLESLSVDAPSSVFWIHGKAGSGKSTLMKYLATHDKTEELLRTWANDKRVVIASYYFWNAGSPLERTQEGLLRSLLFQALCAIPEMIPKLFPQRCIVRSPYRPPADPWNNKELVAAIKGLLEDTQVLSDMRFCFFVDGLDEYEDRDQDPYFLVDSLSELAKCGAAKFCVSSRPWPVFGYAFRSLAYRQLALEELNTDDIQNYVKSELAGDKRFQDRLRNDSQVDELVNDIQKRASGVFLWVYLVVRSLLRGFSAHDDVVTLRERLDLLPSDLHKYFRHMLSNVDEVYQPDAARVLLMAATAGKPVLSCVLHFVSEDRKNENYAFEDHTLFDEHDTKIVEMCEETAIARVGSWCKDLLNIRRHFQPFFVDEEDDGFEERKWRVLGFMHRSVPEFLRTPDVREWLHDLAGAGFDANHTLCRLHLTLIKQLEGVICKLRDNTREFAFSDSPGRFVLLNLMQECATYERVHNSSPELVLDELDKFCNAQFARFCPADGETQLGLRRGMTSDMNAVAKLHWTGLSFQDRRQVPQLTPKDSSFLSYVAYFGLSLYFKGKTGSMARERVQELAPAILASVTREVKYHYPEASWSFVHLEWSAEACLTVVRLLRDHGVDVDPEAFVKKLD